MTQIINFKIIEIEYTADMKGYMEIHKPNSVRRGGYMPPFLDIDYFS